VSKAKLIQDANAYCINLGGCSDKETLRTYQQFKINILQPLLHRNSPGCTAKKLTSVPAGITWLQIYQAVCWARVNWRLIDSQKEELRAYTFLEKHGDNAAFVAATRLHELQSSDNAKTDNSEEVLELRAYASAFQNDLDEWYKYNDKLEEGLVPKSALGCLCIPRHTTIAVCPVATATAAATATATATATESVHRASKSTKSNKSMKTSTNPSGCKFGAGHQQSGIGSSSGKASGGGTSVEVRSGLHEVSGFNAPTDSGKKSGRRLRKKQGNR